MKNKHKSNKCDGKSIYKSNKSVWGSKWKSKTNRKSKYRGNKRNRKTMIKAIEVVEKANIKERIQVISGRSFSETLIMVKEQIQLSIEKLVDKLKTDSEEIPVIAWWWSIFIT